jgi:FAD/FMN-containing dehydrogenase
VDDGVCIDLSRHFNTTRVDPNNKLAYVGGGAVWKTVDCAAIAHGLATVGGTVNHTGVGGLSLGGGYGWLSGEHGLVIDNLTQATVVIANGSVVTASPTSHPGLFWAIRGGGGNFGVVTEFVLKLHPQRKTVFAGLIIFPPSMLNQVMEAADAWWPKIRKKEGALIIIE